MSTKSGQDQTAQIVNLTDQVINSAGDEKFQQTQNVALFLKEKNDSLLNELQQAKDQIQNLTDESKRLNETITKQHAENITKEEKNFLLDSQQQAGDLLQPAENNLTCPVDDIGNPPKDPKKVNDSWLSKHQQQNQQKKTEKETKPQQADIVIYTEEAHGPPILEKLVGMPIVNNNLATHLQIKTVSVDTLEFTEQAPTKPSEPLLNPSMPSGDTLLKTTPALSDKKNSLTYQLIVDGLLTKEKTDSLVSSSAPPPINTVTTNNSPIDHPIKLLPSSNGWKFALIGLGFAISAAAVVTGIYALTGLAFLAMMTTVAIGCTIGIGGAIGCVSIGFAIYAACSSNKSALTKSPTSEASKPKMRSPPSSPSNSTSETLAPKKGADGFRLFSKNPSEASSPAAVCQSSVSVMSARVK